MALKPASPPTNPSLIPAPRKVDRIEVPVLDIRAVIADPKKILLITRLMQSSVELMAQEKAAKTAREGINKQLKEIMKDLPEQKFISDEILISYYPTNRTSLDKQELLKAGVPMTTIVKCTKTSQTWAVRVTPLGAEEDE